MLHGHHRSLLLGAVVIALGMSGCSAGSHGGASPVADSTSSVPLPAVDTDTAMVSGFSGGASARGTADLAVATASTTTASAALGTSRPVSVTFSSSDRLPITGLALSGTVLPAGWSGPATFACATVSTGSGCVLNLTYTPTVIEQGSLSIQYVFVDNSTQPRTGSTLIIPYQSTTNGNVTALASPAGQIEARVGGGSQSVSVNFTTDDGAAASHLEITTDLDALPPGWTRSAVCAPTTIISTGSGCQLLLTYAPTAAATGTLTLNYTFVDASGATQAGSVNIPFVATGANNVTATTAPSGQVLAVQHGAARAVSVAFTTDDGRPASSLSVVTDLTALPAGWTSASHAFTCASLGSGNGCLLQLEFAPATLAPGTLRLDYVYKDGTGNARSGSLNLAYAGTTENVVVDTESPAGPIQAVIGDGANLGDGNHTLSVSFTALDGRPVTGLHLDAGNPPVPPGWTYDAAFSCLGIEVDSVCRLPLSYLPTAAASGTLLLDYDYVNNAGEARTGAVSIAYRATVNDNVVWAASPASLGPVRTGSTTPVTVVFTTDDGLPATGLALTSSLASLPSGWSAAADAFTCATVSSGTNCTLALTYAPAAAGSGTLSLGYTYTNDAVLSGMGTVTLSYAAYTPYLYVANDDRPVSACPLHVDDSIGACAVTAVGVSGADGIALAAQYAYLTSTAGNSVTKCTVGSGTLTACAATGAGFSFAAPTAIAVDPSATHAYVETSAGMVVCGIGTADGSVTACTAAATGEEPLDGLVFSADGSQAYSVHPTNPSTPNSPSEIERCTPTSGALAGCTPVNAGTPQATATLAVRDDQLYVASQTSLIACAINADASITTCQTAAAGTLAVGLAFLDTTAYVSTGTSVLTCSEAEGLLGACTAASDPSFGATRAIVIR